MQIQLLYFKHVVMRDDCVNRGNTTLSLSTLAIRVETIHKMVLLNTNHT